MVQTSSRGPTSCDMEGHAKKCVERYCELTNKAVEQRFQVPGPYLDYLLFRKEELETVGELLKVCYQIVLKCLYLARVGGPGNQWSVNKLTRTVTKWTRACGRRLARLTSCIHNTNDYREYCHVGNTAPHCILGLFQDSDFAGELEDSKSTSGGILCIPFGPK